LPDPTVSPLITPPSLYAGGWGDVNGVAIPDGIDARLPSGCSFRATTLDQWAFPSTTPNLPQAQAACGGGFDGNGWKTIATKVNFMSRSGSVMHFCKTMNGGPVGACIDFDTAPSISLPVATASAPGGGAILAFQPQVVVAAPSTHTCKLWSATSNAGFIKVTGQRPRKDVSAATSFELTVDPNTGPARSGTVTVGYGAGAQVQLTINQDAAPPPCVQIGGSWTVVETATVSCTGSFGSGSTTETATGTLSIAQSGCGISFLSPAQTLRTGTVTGNTVRFSGPLAIAGPDVILTQNQINFSGSIAADTRSINVTGSGVASGTFQGAPGSCSAMSSERFSR
jgi:Putative binding domain, N-terminal